MNQSGRAFTEVISVSVTTVDQATLTVKSVGDVCADFWVPAYQRGYRWGATEVGHLLNDIWESQGEPYRLQPVVVKKVPGRDRWELIDGQQRMTTLMLIFQYMKNAGLQRSGAPFTLAYETRPNSQEYLLEPTHERRLENIDFSHMFHAYECIRRWFEQWEHRTDHVANRFYGYLFESVNVIWYEVPESENSIELFKRLNVGRIPLTDAELVKALILSPHTNGSESDRSREIAAQWDGIERDLQSPEVWAFVAAAREEPTRISLLLDTLADRIDPRGVGRDRPLFHTFETLRPQISEREAFWEEVVDLHSLVVGWYEDRILYHRIGFLVDQGTALGDLIDAASDSTKHEFADLLVDRIRRRIKLSETDLENLTYKNANACNRVLLLMNIETVCRTKDESLRYSFQEHAAGKWSLEHLHAQRSKDFNSEPQWIDWLRLHADVIAALPNAHGNDTQSLIERIRTAISPDRTRPVSRPTFEALEQEVYQVYEAHAPADDGDIDSIANLALLGLEENIALGNSVFEAKRQEVLKLDSEGSYIPICTRNAFLKYYTDANAQQVHFWGPQDRAAYMKAMRQALQPYLLPEGPLV